MRRLAGFLAVGASAAAVHQGAVMALVQTDLLAPLVANVPAFLLAWGVSYFGHRRFSFEPGATHRQAAPRFFAVSLLGFAANQSLYAALLKFTLLNYAVALFLTLVLVAGMTYALGRWWAFAR